MLKKNFKYYAWACDFSPSTGEGKLAREYILLLLKKKIIKNVEIETPTEKYQYCKGKFISLNSLENKIFSRFFCYKYLSPFFGVLKIYFKLFLKKKNTLFLNYLPIWNIFLFIFLPKKTLLGPITGSTQKKLFNIYYPINSLIRIVFFPILIFFSKKILINKFDNLFFSTSEIDFFANQVIKNFQLNYYLRNYKKNKRTKKNIDIFYYNRNHPNKNKKLYYDFLSKLKKNKFNIKICGDYIKNLGTDNLGYLDQAKINNLLKKTKYVLASSENPISFFLLDSLLNDANIIFDIANKQSVLRYYKTFYIFDLQKLLNNNNFDFINKYNLKKTSLKEKNLKKLQKLLDSAF